jgi:hypothetical protein
MAKAEKVLENLKKLYAKQGEINKQILVTQKAYTAAVKEEARGAVKPVAKKVPPKGSTTAPKRKPRAAKSQLPLVF